MSRFPKGLLLAAVLLELMILTTASRTEVFSSNTASTVGVNRMSMAAALPDQSASVKKKAQPRSAATNAASKKPKDKDANTQVFAKAPQHVM